MKCLLVKKQKLSCKLYLELRIQKYFDEREENRSTRGKFLRGRLWSIETPDQPQKDLVNVQLVASLSRNCTY